MSHHLFDENRLRRVAYKRDEAVVIAAYIEDSQFAVRDIVRTWKLRSKLVEIVEPCSFYLFVPSVQWRFGRSVFLYVGAKRAVGNDVHLA